MKQVGGPEAARAMGAPLIEAVGAVVDAHLPPDMVQYRAYEVLSCAFQAIIAASGLSPNDAVEVVMKCVGAMIGDDVPMDDQANLCRYLVAQMERARVHELSLKMAGGRQNVIQ